MQYLAVFSPSKASSQARKSNYCESLTLLNIVFVYPLCEFCCAAQQLATWYSTCCSVSISQCHKDKVYKLYFQANCNFVIKNKGRQLCIFVPKWLRRDTWGDCVILLEWNSFAAERILKKIEKGFLNSKWYIY